MVMAFLLVVLVGASISSPRLLTAPAAAVGAEVSEPAAEPPAGPASPLDGLGGAPLSGFS